MWVSHHPRAGAKDVKPHPSLFHHIPWLHPILSICTKHMYLMVTRNLHREWEQRDGNVPIHPQTLSIFIWKWKWSNPGYHGKTMPTAMLAIHYGVPTMSRCCSQYFTNIISSSPFWEWVWLSLLSSWYKSPMESQRGDVPFHTGVKMMTHIDLAIKSCSLNNMAILQRPCMCSCLSSVIPDIDFGRQNIWDNTPIL